jgi:hypothetical protein
MSNERYTFANERFLTGQLDWITDTFKVLLVNTANYTFLKDVHQYLADVPTDARVATSAALANPVATGGVALADDITINSVSGPLIEAIIIFHDTGSDTTSELICYLDTGIGLPWNPQGGNVVIHWDRGPNGIFKL